jgi:hypothetical protein
MSERLRQNKYFQTKDPQLVRRASVEEDYNYQQKPKPIKSKVESSKASWIQSGNRLTGTETEFNQLAKLPCLKVEVVLAAMV